MDDQTSGAVKAPLEAPVRPAVAVAHGSDKHLTLMGAPWHWNLLHGVDRADMLAFGRACMAAERERCAVTGWNHYMDNCRRLSIAPANAIDWCAATAIRGPKVEANRPGTAAQE